MLAQAALGACCSLLPGAMIHSIRSWSAVMLELSRSTSASREEVEDEEELSLLEVQEEMESSKSLTIVVAI